MLSSFCKNSPNLYTYVCNSERIYICTHIHTCIYFPNSESIYVHIYTYIFVILKEYITITILGSFRIKKIDMCVCMSVCLFLFVYICIHIYTQFFSHINCILPYIFLDFVSEQCFSKRKKISILLNPSFNSSFYDYCFGGYFLQKCLGLIMIFR